MSVLVNRAKMTVASAPGTGVVSLGVAAGGFQSFAAAGVLDQQVVSYVIEDGANWEIGQGVYTAAGPSLGRSNIVASSSGGAAINASSAALVFISPLATDLGGYSPSVKITGNANASTNVGVPYRFPAANASSFTLTLPATASVGYGWCTEEIVNENWTYALNIAVPSGSILDGTTNGTLTVLPQQKVRFRYDADGFHTIWVERCPVILSKQITTAVSNIDWPVPQGYSTLKFTVNRFIPSTASNLIAYVSGNGGSSFRTGTTGDYYFQEGYEASSTSSMTGANGNAAGIILTSTHAAGSGSLGGAGSFGVIEPTIFSTLAHTYSQTGGVNYLIAVNSIQNTGQSNAILNPVNFARLAPSGGGTFTGFISIEAHP